jgi:four helix bundle suffix protein
MTLITQHGGYRHLVSFRIAQLVYDLTERFCKRFINRMSRTNDQMVQAARSGVQNIAEGSKASATSKKTELKLTNVARASLEELLLDYEDFLRHRRLPLWDRSDLRRKDLVNQRFTDADQVARWVQQISKQYSISVEEAAANAIHSLVGVACYLLGKQLQSQADAFLAEGGFTERLYHMRKNRQNGP